MLGFGNDTSGRQVRSHDTEDLVCDLSLNRTEGGGEVVEVDSGAGRRVKRGEGL